MAFDSIAGAIAGNDDGHQEGTLFATSYDRKQFPTPSLSPSLQMRDVLKRVLHSILTGSNQLPHQFSTMTSTTPKWVSLVNYFADLFNHSSNTLSFASLGPNKPATLYVHVGAQPNNSPHFGTITVFTSASIIAQFAQQNYGSIRGEFDAKVGQAIPWPDDLEVIVSLDLVDTAPDNAERIERGDGLQYQRSHRSTNAHQKFLPDYKELMSQLSTRYGVEVHITTQHDLMSSPYLCDVLLEILSVERDIRSELAPEKEALALRRACPVPGCGIAEKHGIRNRYHLNGRHSTIEFYCPDHGYHQVSLSNPDEVKTIEMNTPLRNLVRTRIYAKDTEDSRKDPGAPLRMHMKVTGADYAGFYQEQLLWRQLSRLPNPTPPVVFYTPLITDWAGSKISKSLYVKDGAYKYLKDTNMEYVLSYEKMKEHGVDIEKVFDLIEEWMKDMGDFTQPHSVDSLRLAKLTDSSDNVDDNMLVHDGDVHDPLGSGAYIFKSSLLIALARYLSIVPPTARFFSHDEPPPDPADLAPCALSVRIEFNHDDPTIGSIINTMLAFRLASELKKDSRNPCKRAEVVVCVENMDNKQLITRLLEACASNSEGLTYCFETEEELLRSPYAFSVLRMILSNNTVSQEMDLSTLAPPISHTCPVEGCGISNPLSSKDPYRIEDDRILFPFECGTHGRYTVTFKNGGSHCTIKLSKQLRRLVRTMVLARRTAYERHDIDSSESGEPYVNVHMQLMGWENAGFMQEQMLWRPLMLLDDPSISAAFPCVFYSPLIIDWAGRRISNTMVREGRYDYLKDAGMGYLLSLSELLDGEQGLDPLFRAVRDWVDNPKKLFRPYSIAYFQQQYEPEAGMVAVATDKPKAT